MKHFLLLATASMITEKMSFSYFRGATIIFAQLLRSQTLLTRSKYIKEIFFFIFVIIFYYATECLWFVVYYVLFF